jgi:ABC-type transport system involved in cytochrome bd biosynthesis fused ATPase/permease subunit
VIVVCESTTWGKKKKIVFILIFSETFFLPLRLQAADFHIRIAPELGR